MKHVNLEKYGSFSEFRTSTTSTEKSVVLATQMVRETPLYDFLIIFNAVLCEMTSRIRISNYFGLPDKIDLVIAVF